MSHLSTSITNPIKFKPSQSTSCTSCGHLCASQNRAEKQNVIRISRLWNAGNAYKCRKLGNMKYFTKELHCGLQRTHPPTHIARRLQSCVGTQARLGYAAFDAESLFCHYTVRYTVPISLCVGVFACMSTRERLSSPRSMLRYVILLTRQMMIIAGGEPELCCRRRRHAKREGGVYVLSRMQCARVVLM